METAVLKADVDFDVGVGEFAQQLRVLALGSWPVIIRVDSDRQVQFVVGGRR